MFLFKICIKDIPAIENLIQAFTKNLLKYITPEIRIKVKRIR